jgi:SAM-dependent methyltransferase
VSIIGFIKARWTNLFRSRQKKKILARSAPPNLGPANWQDSLRDPTQFYLECFRFFHQQLPQELRDHRKYFTRQRRGFGEDVFHVMWFWLFREFKPRNFLEIGVYRGQVISLATLLAREGGLACEVHGISPFTPAGDSTSSYRPNVNYYEDTLKNFDHFGLSRPRLLRAYSTDPEALQLIRSRLWDMIYIDGNHDYDVVHQDWEVCSRNLKPGGIIVIDDAGLGTSFRPPGFAFAGYPGPSQVVQEIDRSRFRELLHVGHNRVFQKIA